MEAGMGGWMSMWIDEGMHGWMGVWMDGSMCGYMMMDGWMISIERMTKHLIDCTVLKTLRRQAGMEAFSNYE